MLAFFLGSSFAYAAPQLPCASLDDYKTLLVQVSDKLKDPKADLDELAYSLPFECKINDAGKNFNIPIWKIQADLRELAKENDKEDREDKVAELQQDFASRVKGIEAYSRGADPTAKSKIHEILTRREFRKVGGQDARSLIYEELMQLLIQVFSYIAHNTEEAALFSKVFVWTIFTLAVAFLLYKVYRWATRERPADARREFLTFAPSSKSWQRWMEDARAAMARGELREAVHSGYWAAISHLESSGAWAVDRARTPREYLRLLKGADPVRPMLVELTRGFEISWYGNRIPAPADCETFLTKVEQITCR